MTSWLDPDPEPLIRALSFLPIAVCSVIGFGITLWKWRQLREPPLAPDIWVRTRDAIQDGELAAATRALGADRSRAARLTRTALQWASTRRGHLDWRLQTAGAAHIRELDYGLGTLGLIATLGPLFGLLGTVIGITVVFNHLAASGALGTPGDLAGGIGTALHTTIAGLMVGVLALVCHRYLAARATLVIGELEAVAAELVDLIEPDRS